jgi:hypothetical protein
MVHLPSLEPAMETRHNLIAQIEKEFRANMIEFAIPARNVNLVDSGKPA